MFELRKVNKYFPGVHALKDVDFKINKNEIVGLIGENGAGKSTMIKILYGAYQYDSGEMLINGNPIRFQNSRQAMDMGVGMVFQEQSLIPNLSLMENIFLGFEKQFIKFGVINKRKMAEATRKQLSKVRLDINPYTATSKLSFSQRQLVELAKVLALEERVKGDLVILLDEPTSVLANEEIQLLFDLVRDLRSRASFIFISHRLDEVLAISERIYVLKDGSIVHEAGTKEASIKDIQRKMVGREVSSEFYMETGRKSYDNSKPLIELKNLSKKGSYNDINLKLCAGEVLCLVGSEGSGAEEILRTIFGFGKFNKGNIYLENQRLQRIDPTQAVKKGIGYIPRERKIEGIIGGMNVYENMTLSQLKKFSHFGWMNIKKEKKLAVEWIDALSIKVPSESSDCSSLSGGNQQKIVLAKWRSGELKVILMDHPTRGLDIGAKQDVYRLIRKMSEQGIGIILVADTLEESIGLSHNIIVIKDGKIQEHFECGEGTPEPYDLLQHMI